MTNLQELKYVCENEIITIMLDRPASHNRINTSLLADLSTALNQATREKETKLLVLTGNGNSFSLGADLDEISEFTLPEIEAFVRKGQAVIQQLHALAIPTLAAVNGMALGGGFELALACDMRWAHKRALMGFPESKESINPAWGGTQSLKQYLPESLRTELLLTGDYLKTKTAYQLGLVSRIYEGRDFMDQVLKGVAKIVARRRNVLIELKGLLQTNISLEQGMEQERSAFIKLWAQRPE